MALKYKKINGFCRRYQYENLKNCVDVDKLIMFNLHFMYEQVFYLTYMASTSAVFCT